MMTDAAAGQTLLTADPRTAAAGDLDSIEVLGTAPAPFWPAAGVSRGAAGAGGGGHAGPQPQAVSTSRLPARGARLPCGEPYRSLMYLRPHRIWVEHCSSSSVRPPPSWSREPPAGCRTRPSTGCSHAPSSCSHGTTAGSGSGTATWSSQRRAGARWRPAAASGYWRPFCSPSRRPRPRGRRRAERVPERWSGPGALRRSAERGAVRAGREMADGREAADGCDVAPAAKAPTVPANAATMATRGRLTGR